MSKMKTKDFVSRPELAYFRMRKRDDGYIHCQWGVYLEGKDLPYETNNTRGFVAGNITHFSLLFSGKPTDLLDRLIVHENAASLDHIAADADDDEHEDSEL